MPAELPLIEPLRPAPNPTEVFRRLAARQHCLYLDSAQRHPTLGRYSFLAAEPYQFVQVPADGSDALAELAVAMARCPAAPAPDLPPFQGGAAGLFSYDLGRSLERLPRPRYDEFQAPALAVGMYDVVLAFDHGTDEAYLISQGWPETDPKARADRAAERLCQFKQWITGDPPAPRRPAALLLDRDALAPQFQVEASPKVTSNFSRTAYLSAVRRAIEYIYAGDIFQVNLSQRLLCPARQDAASLYLRLRQANPAPFAGYMDLGDWQIISASPERFVQARDGQVEARPIKGTRPRTALPEADLYAADDLLESAKDRAENVMIVDLLRNDLSQVCEPESVYVSQLCRLEIFQYVQHLVSAVRGRLAPGRSPLDLLRASFPGGSITGAPKVRAMEIIAELEPTARGPYCGSLGYIGCDGSMDLSILIRTITASRGWLQIPVGGGIVAQSDPAREYEETWHKARGLLQAL